MYLYRHTTIYHVHMIPIYLVNVKKMFNTIYIYTIHYKERLAFTGNWVTGATQRKAKIINEIT